MVERLIRSAGNFVLLVAFTLLFAIFLCCCISVGLGRRTLAH